jgi:hypothetical protein
MLNSSVCQRFMLSGAGLLLLIISGLASIVLASPASAITCTPGIGCDRRDPQSTGCSVGATALAPATNIYNSSGTKVGSVQMRWSPTCRTAWSRVTATTSRTIRAGLKTATGPEDYQIIRGGTQVWSQMRYLAPGRGFWAATGRLYFLDNSGSWYKHTDYFGIG